MKFANKCIKSEKAKNMFPLRVKDHPMEIREEEIFVVSHANTERVRKSAIPYMQWLLNKNKEEVKNVEENYSKIRRPG